MNLAFPANPEEVFSLEGKLARSLEGFEYREEQLRMAESVLAALRSDQLLIVEAGTGVGKSLAYLVPLALWLMDEDTPRAIVSTYSKALQKQLFEKELPFIKKHFFPQLRFALAFGSENYLCLKRYEQSRQFGLFDAEDDRGLPLLAEWVGETLTGLRSEISVAPSLWSKVNRESDTCAGRKCLFFKDCFFQNAKAAERKANIIVANHHLFFAHVASEYSVLPEAHCVVFDEAHELESVASDYLCLEASGKGLRQVLDSIINRKGKGLLMRLKWLDPGQVYEMSALVEATRNAGERFFHALQEKIGERKNVRIREPLKISDEISEPLEVLRSWIEKVAELSGDEEEAMEIGGIDQRIRAFKLSFDAIREMALDDHVFWAYQDSYTTGAVATPLSISSVLRERVFSVFSPAILTSATLSVNDSFDFIQAQLGLHGSMTNILRSPFDFKEQARLYIPKNMPDPNMPEFAEAVSDQVDALLAITGGRTMVLFTSYALMEAVSSAIATECTVLKQGDMDNYLLLEEFRNNPNSVLLGTFAFWQGVDLMGDFLKCVVITRLPFSVPTDPVLEARLEHMADEGKKPFMDYQVPAAVLMFKQGFGRLIRSSSDKGVVAVLDSRIVKKQYGRFFLNSLPEIGITNNIHEIQNFFGQKRG